MTQVPTARRDSRFILWGAVAGLLIGSVVWGVNFISIAEGWSRGYTGMFGPVFSIVVTLVILVGGGVLAGLLIGLVIFGVRKIVKPRRPS